MRGETMSAIPDERAGVKRALAMVAALALAASMLIGFSAPSQAQDPPQVEPPAAPQPCDLDEDSLQFGESGETGGMLISLTLLCDFEEQHTNELSVTVDGDTVFLVRDTYDSVGEAEISKEIHLPGVDTPPVPGIKICISVDGEEHCIDTGDLDLPDQPGIPEVPEVPGDGLPEVPEVPEVPGDGLPEVPEVPGDGLPDVPGDPGGVLPELPGLGELPVGGLL